MYGRVTADQVPDFLGITEAGQIAKAFARGRTGYQPAAQAAEILASEHSACVSTTQATDGIWQVQFKARTVRVQSRETMGMASCGDTKQKAAVTWSLVS